MKHIARTTWLWVAWLLASPHLYASPQLTPPLVLGLDFALPYTIAVDGNQITQRSNITLGVDGRYFLTNNINLGLRTAFDIEEQTGTVRKVSLAPGIQYHWFQGETWMPFTRFDLPFLLRGGASTAGKNSQKDMGGALGAGIAWNLGRAIGIDHMVVRYDFSIQYYFGLSQAQSQWNLEFFKVGLEYRF
ncbi:MAG: hypothetical protein R3A11_00180 [Bdellovibrionota bacterium]